MKFVKGIKVPIKMWLDNIEEGALEQAKNLSSLPFIFKHVALMPDSHQGYGMPIGCVIATTNVIIPNAVGVDIGCGMRAVKTSLNFLDKNILKNIIESIKNTVPVGFSHQKNPQLDWLDKEQIKSNYIISQEYQKSLYQLGTLGGGNHFIEIQKDSDKNIWIMLHSGSRNLGYKVANYYNKVAKNLNKKWYSSVPESFQLAFLPHETKEFDDYLNEMNLCIKFAELNRKYMMEQIKNIFKNIFPNICFPYELDVPHNYVKIENHFGKNVYIHRKGAIQAYENQYGIIPGSQGSASYIVKGKGNRESFCSCSHGAGRNMSRTAARKNLNLQTEIEKMDNLGIIHNIKSEHDLDEADGAYKDISTVMKNQEDLVEIVTELKPIGVIKGK